MRLLYYGNKGCLRSVGAMKPIGRSLLPRANSPAGRSQLKASHNSAELSESSQGSRVCMWFSISNGI